MLLSLTIIICVLASIVSHPSAQTQHDYDVIIMGAGSAGIAAAKTLYEANITNILIIEAQWYVGGRTVVHHFSDYMLNIGASWISGACITSSNCSYYNETNPMLTAAYKYNISFVISDYEHGTILDFGGNEHDTTDSNNAYSKFYEASDCAWNIMQNASRSNPDDMSFFAALYLCGWRKPHSAIEKTVQWLNFEFESQHAKWSTASDHFDWSTYSAYGTDDLFITDPRGYQGIIKALAKEFLDIDNIDDEEKIILNSPITTIQYDENGVTVTLDNDNETQYSANYGILTFSVGVLQSDIVEFVPKLPPWKLDALLGFDYVDYTIIFVKWPYNFWNDTIVNISEFIILNDDRFGFFTWIYNLDHPNLYNGSLIWRFDVSLDLAHIVQYGYNNTNPNDTITQIIDLKLSHYFDNIPMPDNIFVASWGRNKYVQGAYSNWPPGFSADSKEAMSWPLLQRLFFAGEAFTEFGYGYVHSAWLSGNHTANQILSCMGNHSNDSSLTNQTKCPSEYIPPLPPSIDDDCETAEESVFKDLVWLWLVLSVIFGIILGYLFAKYCKITKEKVRDGYGAVDDTEVPMVTQGTAQRE